MTHSILFDAHLCTGCRGCQVACKQWNDLEASDDDRTPAATRTHPGSPPRPTWYMKFKEIEEGDKVKWVFGRHACMHCEQPGVRFRLSPAGAHKTKEGPGHLPRRPLLRLSLLHAGLPLRDADLRVGSERVPGALDQKVHLLLRPLVRAGREPACVQTCTTGALKYGQREDLLAYAKERIQSTPTSTCRTCTAKTEAGGTSLLYISHVPFEHLGLPTNLGDKPISARAEDAMFATPIAAVGLAAGLTGFYWIVKRRQKMAQKSGTAPRTKGLRRRFHEHTRALIKPHPPKGPVRSVLGST